MKRHRLILDDEEFADWLQSQGDGKELGRLQWELILSGFGKGEEFRTRVCWKEAIRRLRLKYERNSRE